MAKKTTTKTKHFWDMTPAERDEAVKEFDKPLPPSRAKPLSKKQRLLWEKARASKPDVSIVVKGARTEVIIHLDDDLMRELNEFAQKSKMSLPKMIDRGLRGLLAFNQ